MSTFLRSALVLVAILSSASTAMARPIKTDSTPVLSDINRADSDRAFWDNLQRWGS
jgi:hypothetical protein